MLEVSFNELLANRAAADSTLFVEAKGSNYEVSTITSKGVMLLCVVLPNTNEAIALLALQPFWNLPVAQEEFRFTTHDFCNPAAWDGRTNGDPAASWATANNGVTYDDVQYRWLDVNDNPVCHLVPTETGVGSVWKDQSNNTIVSFNSTTQHWERLDNSANVTSSRWSIIPYPNTKMKIVMANALFGKDATIQPSGSLRYTVFMNYSPYGVIPVKQFVYTSTTLMQLSSDTFKEIGQDILSIYDYRTTVEPSIDSLASMRLEITLDNHLPVTSVTNRPAQAVFIGKKIASF